MRLHPGEVITRYDFCSVFAESYMKSATMELAISGFRACGVYPLNSAAVPPNAFTASERTDRHATVSAVPTQRPLPPTRPATGTIASTDTPALPEVGRSRCVYKKHGGSRRNRSM